MLIYSCGRRKTSWLPSLWEEAEPLACIEQLQVAIDLRHYKKRYDAVLTRFSNLTDQTELSPTTQPPTDLSDGYEFPMHIVPMHIVPTDLSPDMFCPAEISHACRIDSKLRDQFEAAAERKEEKYKELVTGMGPNSSLWKLAPEE